MLYVRVCVFVGLCLGNQTVNVETEELESALTDLAASLEEREQEIASVTTDASADAEVSNHSALLPARA